MVKLYKDQITKSKEDFLQSQQEMIGDKIILIQEINKTFKTQFGFNEPKEELPNLIRFLETKISNKFLNLLSSTLTVGIVNKQEITAQDLREADQYCATVSKDGGVQANALMEFILTDVLPEANKNIEINTKPKKLPFNPDVPKELAAISYDAIKGHFEGSITLGKTPENNIRVKDPYVSREHCKISFENGRITGIEDLGSNNGTYVNSTKIEEHTELQVGDQIQIGETFLKVQDGNRLEVTLNGKNPATYDINKIAEAALIEDSAEGSFNGQIRLGRTPENSIQILDRTTSRQHCQILFTEGQISGIEDLDSRSGTYVNGNQISGFTDITNGDQIQIGETIIKVINNNRLVVKIGDKNPVSYDIDKDSGKVES